jgi:hypothetical protein
MVPHRLTSGHVPSRSMRPRCTLITTVSMTEPTKLAISLRETRGIGPAKLAGREGQ